LLAFLLPEIKRSNLQNC